MATYIEGRRSAGITQVDTVIVQGAPGTETLLNEMIVQLKVQNAHLVEVTGEMLDENDIPEEVR